MQSIKLQIVLIFDFLFILKIRLNATIEYLALFHCSSSKVIQKFQFSKRLQFIRIEQKLFCQSKYLSSLESDRYRKWPIPKAADDKFTVIFGELSFRDSRIYVNCCHEIHEIFSSLDITWYNNHLALSSPSFICISRPVHDSPNRLARTDF